MNGTSSLCALIIANLKSNSMNHALLAVKIICTVSIGISIVVSVYVLPESVKCGHASCPWLHLAMIGSCVHIFLSGAATIESPSWFPLDIAYSRSVDDARISAMLPLINGKTYYRFSELLLIWRCEERPVPGCYKRSCLNLLNSSPISMLSSITMN